MILSALLVACSGLFFVPHSKAETSTQDQYCAPGVETSYDMLGAGGIVRSQTFEPSLNRLTEVYIKIGGLNLTGGTPITLKLYGPGFDGPEMANKTILPTMDTPSYRSWVFSSPVTVTPGTTYKLVLSTTGPGSVYWYYGEGDQNCDGKNRTYAFRDSNRMTWDWNYKTLGYNVVDSTGGTSQTETGDAVTTTATTSETLGTTTTSIVKPTTLTVAYSDTDRGIKLTWKASTTTDIDGYKVFRYEGDVKTPVKIASTAKDKLEYLDTDVVAGKTYSYQIRAYKADTQSVSSNIATATVPADAAPAKPVNFKVVDKTFNSIEVMWRKSTDPNISGYTLNLYRGGDKIRTAEIPATVRDYSFLNLDAGTLYKIELVAKSSNGLTSAPAVTFGFTQLPEALERFMDTTRTIAGLVVLVLLLILAINTSRHYKEKK